MRRNEDGMNKIIPLFHMSVGDVLRIGLMGVFVVICIALVISIIYVVLGIAISVVILMQEGKSQGLGAIAGAADTYWGKNKGRSMEGKLVKITKILVILFVVIAVILNFNF